MNFKIMEPAFWAALKVQPALSLTPMPRPPGLSQDGSGTTQSRRAVFVGYEPGQESGKSPGAAH